MRKLILLFAITFLINGCSKDDNQTAEEQQEQFIDGGIISKFQLVSQEIENLTEDTYQGTINGNTITLVRSNLNTISFLADENFEIGESVLEIPSIDKKIKYTVNNTVLQNSVDETLDNLTSNFTNYVDSLGNTNNTPQENYVISSVENYNTTLQQLSVEDRETIALVYEANKDFFDNLYQIDYTVPQGRMMSPDYSNLSFSSLTLNWAGATLGAGTATWLAVASSANVPVALFLGTSAIILWQISYDLWSEGIDRANVVYENFEFDDFISIPTGKTMMTSLEFDSGIAKSIDYDINSRGVNSSDVNNDNSVISSFFSTLTDFNGVIDNLNSVINVINSIPFSNISLIDNVSVGNSQQENSDANQEIFNNLSFSLDNSNLELTNVSFDNGNINITISIIDETIVNDFVESSISYSYNDETNDFTGSFPIKVFKEDDILDLLQSNFWNINEVGGGNFEGTVTSYDGNGNVTGTQTLDCCGGLNSVSFNDNGTIGINSNTNYNYTINQYSVSQNNVSFSIKIESSSLTEEYSFNGVKDSNNELFTGTFSIETNEYVSGSLIQNTIAGGSATLEHN